MSKTWNTSVMIHLRDDELPENFVPMLRSFLANAVKTDCSLHISSDKDEVGTLEILPGCDPYYRCAECGSPDVQHALWVGLNDGVPDEVFGSWCNGDNSYCNGCGENTKIIGKSDQEDEAWDEYLKGKS